MSHQTPATGTKRCEVWMETVTSVGQEFCQIPHVWIWVFYVPPAVDLLCILRINKNTPSAVAQFGDNVQK